MNEKDLDTLLSRYYRGETTLDEERLLRESLAGDDADAMLMKALQQMENEIEVPNGLEDELSDMIDQWQDEEQRGATYSAAWWKWPALWSLAASVILLMAAGWWFMRDRAKVNVVDDKPVIAKTDNPKLQDTVSDVVEPQDLLEPQVEQDAQTVAPAPIKARQVRAYRPKEMAQHASQLAQNIGEEKLSPEDEQQALEALEKFSTVLNKGMGQLNNAEEKIDDINNTIKQHLL